MIPRRFHLLLIQSLLVFLLPPQTPAQLIIENGTFYGAPGSLTSRKFSSPNGKFSLVVDQFSPISTRSAAKVDLSASLGPADPQSTRPKWTRALNGDPLAWLWENQVHVSDQGDYFLVVEDHNSSLALYKQTSKQIFELDQSAPPAPLRPASPAQLRPGFPRRERTPQPIFQVREQDGERIFAFWDRDENQWTAYKIGDGAKIKTSPETAKLLNEETRRGILDKFEKARRSILLRKFGGLPEPIAKITGAKITRPRPVDFGIHEGDLEFITQLHNPEDRQWLEFFLNSADPDGGYHDGPSLNSYRSNVARPEECFVALPDRIIADRLLAIWENKFKPSKPLTESVGPLRDGFFPFGGSQSSQPDPTLYFLGKISGKIQLPAPFTPLSRRNTRIRLNLLSQGSSLQTERAIFIGNPRAGAIGKPVFQIPFTFLTVHPGTYRLKVIWDKRRPFTDTEKAGPGDYESDLSPPIFVTAGTNITGLSIQCTNRIPGGEPYYAADELRAKLKFPE